MVAEVAPPREVAPPTVEGALAAALQKLFLPAEAALAATRVTAPPLVEAQHRKDTAPGTAGEDGGAPRGGPGDGAPSRGSSACSGPG